MYLRQIREILHKAQRLVQAIAPEVRESFLYEYYEDGPVITWRFANGVSPQEMSEQVQTAAIWLWSLKDYLKANGTEISPQLI